MATFESTTKPMTFAQMEARTKSVYVVPRDGSYDGITSGDRIEFDNLGSITIGAIRRYSNLDELLEMEGFANVSPDAESAEQAISSVHEQSEWTPNIAADAAVMALRVRAVKRKS